MTRRIFVDLPAADVARATACREAPGFARNAMFSGERASSVQRSDAIVAMLPDPAFCATFTTKRIVDARTGTGALPSLSRDSRAEVRSQPAGACDL